MVFRLLLCSLNMNFNITNVCVSRPIRGGQILVPVNVASGGVACTLNTRYDGLSETTDIITLAHYPKTVVLIEYEL